MNIFIPKTKDNTKLKYQLVQKDVLIFLIFQIGII